MTARPITRNIDLSWRHAVSVHSTTKGLTDWMNSLDDAAYLGLNGFYLAERDPVINMEHKGAWQVTEHYMPGERWSDGNGPWAIVGDDKAALVREAFDRLRPL